MSDVTIKYKGQPIATMDATGSKTLNTQGKYCEDDIGVEYVKPAAPTGTKQISITENGTVTEDVAAFASAEITVDVQGGGDDLLAARLNNTLTQYTSEDVTTTPSSAFQGASALKYLYLPNCLSIGGSLLAYNTGIKCARFPKANRIDNNGAFNGANAIELIDLGLVGWIPNQTFQNCSSLTKLILRRADGVSSMAGVAVLATGTPFKNGGSGGEVYIPKAMYDHLGDGTSLDYKSNTNWATIDGYGTITWRTLEGSAYEDPDWVYTA